VTDLDQGTPVADAPSVGFGPSAHPWTPIAALWLVALALTVSVMGSLALQVVMARDLTDTVTALLAGGILTLGYLIELGVVLSVYAACGKSFSAGIGLVRPRAESAATWVGAAIGAALLARLFAAGYGIVVQTLGLELPGAGADPLSIFPGGPLSVAVLFVVVVLIAPFAEEVVFRGVLLPALGVRWGTMAAVVLSAALFSAFHLSVFLLLPIFVAAVVFAQQAIRFRSLWPAILAHAVFNGVAVLLVLLFRARGLV